MLYLGLKLLALSVIYFAGWLLVEKVIDAIYKKKDKASDKASFKKRKIIPIAQVTPLDQTWRYIKGLKSPDWRVRRIACIQLGERRGTAVVEALIEALNDSREEVCLAASDALVKIGDPAAIEAITR